MAQPEEMPMTRNTIECPTCFGDGDMDDGCTSVLCPTCQGCCEVEQCSGCKTMFAAHPDDGSYLKDGLCYDCEQRDIRERILSLPFTPLEIEEADYRRDLDR